MPRPPPVGYPIHRGTTGRVPRPTPSPHVPAKLRLGPTRPVREHRRGPWERGRPARLDDCGPAAGCPLRASGPGGRDARAPRDAPRTTWLRGRDDRRSRSPVIVSHSVDRSSLGPSSGLVAETTPERTVPAPDTARKMLPRTEPARCRRNRMIANREGGHNLHVCGGSRRCSSSTQAQPRPRSSDRAIDIESEELGCVDSENAAGQLGAVRREEEQCRGQIRLEP